MMNYKTLLPLLLLLITVNSCFMGKKTDYDKSWKEVEKLYEDDRKINAALSLVANIREKAKADKNGPELIKSIMYTLQYLPEVEEDYFRKSSNFLEKEIANAAEPEKSILHSIAGQFYQNTFNNLRWKIYNRTTVSSSTPDDPKTWSVEDFHNKMQEHYLASLEGTENLKSIPVSQYGEIIYKGNTPEVRPTLYDIVVHRALEYFQSDERILTTPDVFVINDPAVFSEAREFIASEFSSADSASLHLKALQLFQHLIAFHLNQGNIAALIDADLKRIKFVKEYAVLTNKEELYEQALYRLGKAFGTIPANADTWHELILFYINKGNSWQPYGDDSNKDMLKKAVALGDSILQQADSDSYNKIYNSIQEIKKPYLSVQAEQVNAVNTPFRILINYKNTPKVFVKVIRINKVQRGMFTRRSWEEESWKELAKLPAISTSSFALPATEDYHAHSVELPVNSLPSGEYAVMVSDDENFSVSQSSNYSLAFIYVSDLTYLKNDNHIYILNAVTGKPVENAIVTLWNRYYNAQTNDYTLTELGTYATDNTGHFEMKLPEKQNALSLSFEIAAGNDRIHVTEDNVYYTLRQPGKILPDDEYEKQNTNIHFFTDRAIYRPGQDVFFKGILITRDPKTGEAKIISNKTIRLYFRDPNNQVTDSISVTSNAYGSIHGRFSIPEDRLNGIFRITAEGYHSSHFVSVEEYKRPKYQVSLTPEKKSYRFHDNVSVKGLVEGYAGNLLGGTKVSYRVIRKPIFRPFPWYLRRSYLPAYSGEVEITNGETTSSHDGTFEISFKAIPDEKPGKTGIKFLYEVIVHTTDISGEGGEAKAFVHAGYNNLEIQIDFPFEISPKDKSYPVIKTTDLAGDPLPAVVKTTVYELETYGKKYRKRLWNTPDQYVLSKAEFEKLFPYDEYEESENPERFKIRKVIVNRTDSVGIEGVALDNISLNSGWYKIVSSSKLPAGDTATTEHYVNVLSSTSNGALFVDTYSEKPAIQKGEQANLIVTSNIPDVHLFYTRQNDDEAERGYEQFSGEKSFNLKDRNYSTVEFNLAAVYQHRLFRKSVSIPVADTTHKLDIELVSFRDKLLPGSKETWTVKITSGKGDKVAAELLTAMYDLSLDQYRKNIWNIPSIYRNSRPLSSWGAMLERFAPSYDKVSSNKWKDVTYSEYPEIIVPGLRYSRVNELMGRSRVIQAQNEEIFYDDQAGKKSMAPPVPSAEASNFREEETPVQIRTNLNETAFFFPELKTDANGSISFTFDAPEALTAWKWMLLAHDKSLAFGYKEANIVTQKELMVQPNMPRFLREGDRINLKLRISNLTDKELTGTANLRLSDATTGIPVDGWFNNVFPDQYFTVGPKETVVASFNVTVPAQFSKPVTYTFTARSGNHSDGESSVIPVVSSRILVTETYPVNLTEQDAWNITIPSLSEMDSYTTANPHALTIEFSSNPVWYAVQALPYLKNSDCDCIDQAFNVYYANALASRIMQSMPAIKTALQQWKVSDSSQFLSNLEKNQELKNILLKETPWVLEAQSEGEQKRNLMLLFEMANVDKELTTALNRIKEWQSSSGGFTWIKGFPYPDRYMTLYLIEGFGKLKKANAIPEAHRETIDDIVEKALNFLDQKEEEDYSKLLASKTNLKHYTLSPLEITYLYARSYFPEIKVNNKAEAAYKFLVDQSKMNWQKQSMMVQALLAIYHQRMGDQNLSKKILASFKDNAKRDPQLGMFWKEIQQGYYWHEGKIEAQARIIDLFNEAGESEAEIAKMKLWILQNKQVNRWHSPRATADAVFALLTRSEQSLSNPPVVTVTLGNRRFSTAGSPTATTLGYVKATIPGDKLGPDLSEIQFLRSNADNMQPTWGAVYYQYFEEADKVAASSNSGLTLEKDVFLIRNTPSGEKLEPIKNNQPLKLGDRVMVRVVIRSDRDMEYVHMKDMRAPALEPGVQLSGYRYQGGLGYYQSVGDLAVNFYFDRLPKGTYVFEYPLQVTQTGTFSNGITTIQNYYAPEFSSHSKGLKLVVEE
jgi:hypothetical protein